LSAEQLNSFLRHVGTEPALQRRLRDSDATAAAELAVSLGFDVAVGDLIRYKARATSWQLCDEELAVVAQWQPSEQPYWWQYIWSQ